MSIQIGNNSYAISMPPLAGGTEAQEAGALAPHLGSADLSSVVDPKLAQMTRDSDIKLPPSPLSNGHIPGGLSDKLDKMSQITDVYAVMALFQQVSQEARNTAREQRQAEMQERVEALGQAAEKMRDAALKRLIATCVQAGIQAAGGAIKIGTSAASLRGAIKAGKMSTEGQKLAQQATNKRNIADKAAGFKTDKFDASHQVAALRKEASSLDARAATFNNRAAAINARSNAQNQIGSGSADMISSAGTIIKGGLDYSAALDDAEKAELEKKAEMARAAFDRANETMQQMRDIIRDIQSKLAEMERSSHDTMKQITRA